MPIKFEPHYTITPKIMNCLIQLESTKEKVMLLPLTPTVLSSLRETAKLYTTHYSTMIEGNALSPDQVKNVIQHERHFPGRKRDEREVQGYYAALTQVEQNAASGAPLTEKMIQTIHALVMADGKTKVKPSMYRDGQNVIRDGRTQAIIYPNNLKNREFSDAEALRFDLEKSSPLYDIGADFSRSKMSASVKEKTDSLGCLGIYMPPEAKDVSKLMRELVFWINKNTEIPCPIVAGICHYQFVTIHPYYDGNGRTARLLTTLILHLGGYDLKGLYSLEEYYARNLGAYYEAISIGESHNYYMGRAEADITKWIEYFLEGMTISFKNVLNRMVEADIKGSPDQSGLIRTLDPRQRKALTLFQEFEIVTSRQIGELFGFKPRTSAHICASWVENGFLCIVDSSNRGRKYKLSKKYENLNQDDFTFF